MHERCDVVVVGAGAAGLAAAECAAAQGARVILVEAGKRPGRKFLVAGRSGLNLTRDADAAAISAESGASAPILAPAVAAFPPAAIRAWAASLGCDTFIGSSGKVFPREMHAAALLHRWLARLRELGVQLRTQGTLRRLQRQQDAWLVESDAGAFQARAVILALGGVAWPQTGSDGAWTTLLDELGVTRAPWQSANCGVEVAWDAFIRQRYAGAALKNIRCQLCDAQGQPLAQSHGEMVISHYGLEGYAIYPLIPAIRAQLPRGRAELRLDLARHRSEDELAQRLEHSRGSLPNRLRKAAQLSPAASALLRQGESDLSPRALAQRCKALPLQLIALRPPEEAISSAGGICWSELDEHFALRRHPGLYAVGEMVDWEAPTGGYLLSICLAMGRWAGDHAGRLVRG